MAVLLKYGSLIPLALRVAVAGGATYGTVKQGVWRDSTESREKLTQMKQAVQKEIEYPKVKARSFMVRHQCSSDS